MRRLIAVLVIASIGMIAPARGQSTSELRDTARYIAAFQNPDGGFAATVGGPSSLGATSSAIRTLRYVGGSIPNPLACIEYVKKCWDGESGGFGQSPGAAPDANTTSIGLMAASELRIGTEEQVKKAIGFLNEHAKTYEEVRLAVAGLEAVKAKSDRFADWTKLVLADRKPDGTWGEGAAKAFATGGAAAALLRMGVPLDQKDAVLAALRAGQRPEGGWAKGDGAPDLSASYRIMRCLYMLGERPDLERLRGFLASCRQSDGGYRVAPGQPASGGGTYYAAIIQRWARQLEGEPAFLETAGFQPLFNGKDLDGWEGDKNFWSARDGMIVGKSPGLDHNEFLASTKTYRDFVLKLSFRVTGGPSSNSGVQFRSVRVPPHEMSGYQADVGQEFWGCLYDESRRNKVLVQASDAAKKAIHPSDWNQYVIRAMGDHISLTLNGVGSVDYRETDAAVARDGAFGLQLHMGGPLTVEFKDIYIQVLPTPAADGALTPGFHLRTLKAADGERKYTLYLPTGYDGSKAFPAVLFLHGAGERGQDGVVPAQVGLGPQIAANPEGHPFIAVFPQARQTWSAGSPDGLAALAALDEVMKICKVDPNKVAITGLSMGGAGSWSIGSAHPDRFSAVVPVCGFGRAEDALKLKAKPISTYLGDDDMARIVSSTRELASALIAAGAKPRVVEYRGVGHNSWDRAYSDPFLIQWMLEQNR